MTENMWRRCRKNRNKIRTRTKIRTRAKWKRYTTAEDGNKTLIRMKCKTIIIKTKREGQDGDGGTRTVKGRIKSTRTEKKNKKKKKNRNKKERRGAKKERREGERTETGTKTEKAEATCWTWWESRWKRWKERASGPFSSSTETLFTARRYAQRRTNSTCRSGHVTLCRAYVIVCYRPVQRTGR